jgi:hypothetical protein
MKTYTQREVDMTEHTPGPGLRSIEQDELSVQEAESGITGSKQTITKTARKILRKFQEDKDGS